MTLVPLNMVAPPFLRLQVYRMYRKRGGAGTPAPGRGCALSSGYRWRIRAGRAVAPGRRAWHTGGPFARRPVPRPPAESALSRQPQPVGPVPAATVRVARAAVPTGNVDLRLREARGRRYADAACAARCPRRG